MKSYFKEILRSKKFCTIAFEAETPSFSLLVRDQTFKKSQSLAFRVKSVFSTVIGSSDDVENI